MIPGDIPDDLTWAHGCRLALARPPWYWPRLFAILIPWGLHRLRVRLIALRYGVPWADVINGEKAADEARKIWR
ncbi:MAG TPA: hypothetical protein VMF62_20140 [Acetobacteraceae bacterium]|nr:hypothetical protein [Acetobacteraceae bacterium]